jgi:leucine dehydrogenase
MDLFASLSAHGFGAVHLVHDAATGLRSIMAVHNTRHGPAIGGCRFVSYPSDEAALVDALRLARGMAYKAAVAGLPHGGGKAVIIKPDAAFDRPALFAAFGRAVDSLGGAYVTCEDSGTGTADMDAVRQSTRHVLGTSGGSGDPSPLTALGVRRGIESAIKAKFGARKLAGLRVVIQGVGHVGYHLARELHAMGAHLVVADTQTANVERCVAEFRAARVAPSEVLDVPCDVFAPCALGAVVNDDTVGRLQCAIVAGAANNVLAEPRHGRALHDRGILYAPDYVINAGGLINVAYEYRPEGHDLAAVRAKVELIHDTLDEIFSRSAATGLPPHEIADRIAEERIYG